MPPATKSVESFVHNLHNNSNYFMYFVYVSLCFLNIFCLEEKSTVSNSWVPNAEAYFHYEIDTVI